MENEDRILELLAELVRTRDQDEERIRQNEERIQQNETGINELKQIARQTNERLNNLDDISAGVLTLLRDLTKRSGETDELRDRIERLEKYTGLN